MPRYEFTARAAEDLREIGRYTKQAWDVVQARRYREELELALKKLSLSCRIDLKRKEIALQVCSFTLPLTLLSMNLRKMGLLFYGYYTLV